jgi:FKBP-type peptidyl-prolyl cis-trans isomerase SlyD
MKIEKNALVAVNYTLTLDNGEVVEKTRDEDPLVFIFGEGRMMPGLEKGIEGMEAGQSRKFDVAPKDAYGDPSEALLHEIPREDFPKGVEVRQGAFIQAQSPRGPLLFRVQEVKDESVVCDFNHPLAGKRLHFDVAIDEVRESTAQDRSDLYETDTIAEE